MRRWRMVCAIIAERQQVIHETLRGLRSFSHLDRRLQVVEATSRHVLSALPCACRTIGLLVTPRNLSHPTGSCAGAACASRVPVVLFMQ